MPDKYYALLVPGWLRSDSRTLSAQARRELEHLGSVCRAEDGQTDRPSGSLARELLDGMLPQPSRQDGRDESVRDLLDRYGFDAEQHEQIRADLRAGRIGLAQNRFSAGMIVEDVRPGDVIDLRQDHDAATTKAGAEAIAAGEVAVVTLAAGIGSRWTEGAGVVKALHPFCKLDGRHRNFLEVHLAKSRRVSRMIGTPIPHVFTTGYLTDQPIRAHLESQQNYDYEAPVLVSPGRSVGLRMIPMVRDLRFEWEEMPQQVLDEQQQKVRESLRTALMGWARQMGEGEDYTDNLPSPMPASGGALVRVSQHAQKRNAREVVAGTTSVEASVAAQHRHAGGKFGPGRLGAASADQGLSFLRGHSPTVGGSRRRIGPCRRPAEIGRGVGNAD